jgi:hypothetical protein
MNPTFKPPGTKRLKLKCDILVSTFRFKFNLRHYNPEDIVKAMYDSNHTAPSYAERLAAGAYTPPLFSST